MSIREEIGLSLFLLGGAALAYILFKQKEKDLRLALALASYCLIGAVLYGWSDLVLPQSIKGPGFEITTVQREITKTKDESLAEIRKESSDQKATIVQLSSELHAQEKAMQQSRDDLKAEVEEANAVILKLNKLDKSVTKLEGRVQARHLSAGDEKKLQTVLCMAAHPVLFQSARDEESGRFSQQVEGVFKSCKWSVEFDNNLFISAFARTPDGVTIRYWEKSLWAKQSATAIDAIFREAGLDTVMESNSTPLHYTPAKDKPSTVELMLLVGPKPVLQ